MPEQIPLVGGPGAGRFAHYYDDSLSPSWEVHLPHDPFPPPVADYNFEFYLERPRYRIARYRLQEANDGGWHYVYMEES